MLWRTKRTKRAGIERRKKLLRFESLELRQMLSGTVTAAVNPGQTLVLTGDGSNNQIEVWQGPSIGEIWVEGTPTTSTFLKLGANTTSAPLQFTNIVNLTVALGSGSTNFQFLSQGTSAGPGVPGGHYSELPGNLYITIGGGNDTDALQDVKIDTCFTVTKNDNGGQATLSMIDVSVKGITNIDNIGTLSGGPFTGDSSTTIEGCTLRNNASIVNGAGSNMTLVAGTTIGVDNDGSMLVNDGNGPDRITFNTFANTQTFSGITTNIVYGNLNLVSGNGLVGLGDPSTVSLTATNVKGYVTMSNVSGDSKTLIGNPAPGDQLGSDVNAGGPVTITRTGVGNDVLDMENSNAPYGLTFDSGTPGDGNQYGSSVKILSSTIGTYSPPVHPVAIGLNIQGDDGNNAILVQDSQIGNQTTVNLGSGDNNVSFVSSASPNTMRTTFAALNVTTLTGEDTIMLSKITVYGDTALNTGGGADLFNIDYLATGTQATPLSQLLGTVTINGGLPFNPVTNVLEYASNQNGVGVFFGSTNFTNVTQTVSP